MSTEVSLDQLKYNSSDVGPAPAAKFYLWVKHFYPEYYPIYFNRFCEGKDLNKYEQELVEVWKSQE